MRRRTASRLAIAPSRRSPLSSARRPPWPQEMPRYWGPHMWEGGWWWFLGPFTMVLFLAVPIALVVLLVRWLAGTGAGRPGPPTEKTALDILRERFARGEIDAAEFEDRKKVLNG